MKIISSNLSFFFSLKVWAILMWWLLFSVGTECHVWKPAQLSFMISWKHAGKTKQKRDQLLITYRVCLMTSTQQQKGSISNSHRTKNTFSIATDLWHRLSLEQTAQTSHFTHSDVLTECGSWNAEGKNTSAEKSCFYLVKTVPLKLQVLLKGSVFCTCRNTPKQTGFLGWGGKRKESNHAVVQLDKTFLGSKSCNMLQGDLEKRVERMHEQLFPKQKNHKGELTDLRHGDVLKSSFLKYSILQKLFLYPSYFTLVSDILSPLVRLSKQCQVFLWGRVISAILYTEKSCFTAVKP